MIVVKVGGDVVAGPHLGAIAADVAELARDGVRVVLVHGGGPQVSALQKRLGQEPKMVGGRRITDAAALEVVKMAVAGAVGVELCAALVAAGARPASVHGAVRATKRPPRVVSGAGPDPVDFGLVGDVTEID